MPTTLAPTDRLLTLMQLASKWGWSRSRLHRLVAAKAIPHLRIGARNDVFFRERDVEAWLVEREIPAKGAPRRQAGDDEAAYRLELLRAFDVDPDHQFS